MIFPPTDNTYSPFMCSLFVLGQVDDLITIRTTTSYTGWEECGKHVFEIHLLQLSGQCHKVTT